MIYHFLVPFPFSDDRKAESRRGFALDTYLGSLFLPTETLKAVHAYRRGEEGIREYEEENLPTTYILRVDGMLLSS